MRMLHGLCTPQHALTGTRAAACTHRFLHPKVRPAYPARVDAGAHTRHLRDDACPRLRLAACRAGWRGSSGSPSSRTRTPRRSSCSSRRALRIAACLRLCSDGLTHDPLLPHSGTMYSCSDGHAARLCDVRTSQRLAAIDWDLPAWGNVLILLVRALHAADAIVRGCAHAAADVYTDAAGRAGAAALRHLLCAALAPALSAHTRGSAVVNSTAIAVALARILCASQCAVGGEEAGDERRQQQRDARGQLDVARQVVARHAASANA